MGAEVTYHKDLASSGRWMEMPFAQQMANIGSEVYRAGKRKSKGQAELAAAASDRALELLDFTVSSRLAQNKDPKELLRLRELLCDYFYGDNEYGSTAQSLYHLLEPFNMMAAQQRHV